MLLFLKAALRGVYSSIARDYARRILITQTSALGFKAFERAETVTLAFELWGAGI